MWRKKSGRPPAESAQQQAIGRSRGGLNTKVMAMVDRCGRLVKFSLMPGNAAEVNAVPALMEGVETGELIADKAYDTDAIRKSLASKRIAATIPPKSNRRVQYQYNTVSYADRHLVENWFADAKHFRGIATRYVKLADSFVAQLNLVGWIRTTSGKTRKPRSDAFGPQQIPMLLPTG